MKKQNKTKIKNKIFRLLVFNPQNMILSHLLTHKLKYLLSTFKSSSLCHLLTWVKSFLSTFNMSVSPSLCQLFSNVGNFGTRSWVTFWIALCVKWQAQSLCSLWKISEKPSGKLENVVTTYYEIIMWHNTVFSNCMQRRYNLEFCSPWKHGHIWHLGY